MSSYQYGAGPTFGYTPPYQRRRRRNPIGVFPDDRRGMTLGAGPQAGYPRAQVPRATAPAGGPPRRPGLGYPGLPSDADLMGQAGTLAQGQIDPILKHIADLINRRGQEGTAAIAGLTGAYAGALERYGQQIPGIYGTAKAEIGATTQAFADRLKGAGKGAGEDLGAALAQAGQSDTGGVDLGEMGAGAGNAAYGTGIADLDALIARQAAAQTQAAMEPGFAYAGGQQHVATLQRDLARQLAEQTGEITSQVPGLVQSIYSTLLGRRTDDRNFAENQRQFNVGQAQRNREIALGRRDDRTARFDDLAARRTQETGYRWVATNTGVRPADTDPRKPGIQRDPTIARQAAEAELGIKSQATAAKAQTDAAKLAQKARTDAASLQQKAAKEAATLQARIDHNKAIEANQQATLAERTRAAKAREQAEKRQRLVKLAEARTKATGYLWVAGPNGIRQAKNAQGKPVKVQATGTTKSSGDTGGTFDPTTGKYG